MFRKWLAILLAVVMTVSAVTVTAFAAATYTDEPACVTESGEDIGWQFGTAPLSAKESIDVGNVISFDSNSVGWDKNIPVSFYFYCVEFDDGWGSDYFPWGSSKTKGSDVDGDGVWTYSPEAHGLELEEGKRYAIIFALTNDFSQQTYSLLFDTSCYGDTAYGTGEMIQNDGRSCPKLAWRTSKLGALKYITYSGDVTGDMLAEEGTEQQLFEDFLWSKYLSALDRSDKDAQTMLDDIGEALGLTQYDIRLALARTNTDSDWDPAKSALPKGSDAPIELYSISGTVKSYLDSDEFAQIMCEMPDGTYLHTADYLYHNGYSLSNLTPGTYHLKFYKENHVDREYEVTITDHDVVLDATINPIGDVNGDGKITVADAGKINNHIKKKTTLTGYELDCADVDGNGRITVADAGKLNNHIKKKALLW